MIRLLRANSSGSDLLFKKLPTTFAYDDFTADAAGDIVSAKTIYDGLLNELKKHLIEETNDRDFEELRDALDDIEANI